MRRLLLLAVLAGLAVMVMAAPTSARQSDDGGEDADAPPATEQNEAIGGTLTRVVDGERTGVEGVRITVSIGGDRVGRDTTDEDGEWLVGVPGPGTYDVELDEDSLPDEVSLRNPDRNPLVDVAVRPGQTRRVLFPLGERSGGTSQALDRLIDLFAQGIRLGAITALAALGLSLIYGVTGLVNFAHGELVTLGAVLTYLLSTSGAGPGIHLIPAAAIAFVLSGVAGAGMEKGLWAPLRRRQTGNIARMVVSIGLALVLRHIILVAFGSSPRPYSDYTVQRSMDIGPVSMTPKDFVITLLSLGLLVAVGVLLQTTRTGTALRAVADNKDLAASSGIDVPRIIFVTWVGATALAGLGGTFLGASEVVAWDMGFTLLLIMFAAVILGGLGSAYGAMVGGLLIGVTSQMSSFWIPVEFKQLVALGALILVLLVRPNGILGIAARVG